MERFQGLQHAIGAVEQVFVAEGRRLKVFHDNEAGNIASDLIMMGAIRVGRNSIASDFITVGAIKLGINTFAVKAW